MATTFPSSSTPRRKVAGSSSCGRCTSAPAPPPRRTARRRACVSARVSARMSAIERWTVTSTAIHLRAQAQSTPDKPAYSVASTGEVVTYRQPDEASNRLAHVFADAGLVEGDSIALMLENHLHF